ncbi:MAG: hypothetical protein WCF67_17860 [Chitinophagaceae bacterium]
MRKFQFLFGALAISAALMFMTEAKASPAAADPECEPRPNDCCFVGWDAFGEPIYLVDYSDFAPQPF